MLNLITMIKLLSKTTPLEKILMLVIIAMFLWYLFGLWGNNKKVPDRTEQKRKAMISYESYRNVLQLSNEVLKAKDKSILFWETKAKAGKEKIETFVPFEKVVPKGHEQRFFDSIMINDK